MVYPIPPTPSSTIHKKNGLTPKGHLLHALNDEVAVPLRRRILRVPLFPIFIRPATPLPLRPKRHRFWKPVRVKRAVEFLEGPLLTAAGAAIGGAYTRHACECDGDGLKRRAALLQHSLAALDLCQLLIPLHQDFLKRARQSVVLPLCHSGVPKAQADSRRPVLAQRLLGKFIWKIFMFIICIFIVITIRQAAMIGTAVGVSHPVRACVYMPACQ